MHRSQDRLYTGSPPLLFVWSAHDVSSTAYPQQAARSDRGLRLCGNGRGTGALGLGTTLTTRHLLYEKEAEEALGLPAGVHSYAILPIGYPMGNFGPVKRGPLKDVVYQDRWGQAWAGA